MICIYTASFLILRFVSPAGKASREQAATHSTVRQNDVPTILVAVGLAGVFLFYLGVGTFWALMERLGEHVSIATETIATSISLAAFAGGVGGLAAVVLNLRIGRLLPVVATIATTSVILGFLADSVMQSTYLVSGIAVVFGWNYLYPYIAGVLITIDGSARLVALLASLQAFAFALGPPILSLLFGDNIYKYLASFTLFCYLMSLSLLLPLVISAERLRKRVALNCADNSEYD